MHDDNRTIPRRPVPPDPRVVLDALLRRARVDLERDVQRGVLTRRQAEGLFRATVRRYTKRLGIPLPLTA